MSSERLDKLKELLEKAASEMKAAGFDELAKYREVLTGELRLYREFLANELVVVDAEIGGLGSPANRIESEGPEVRGKTKRDAADRSGRYAEVLKRIPVAQRLPVTKIGRTEYAVGDAAHVLCRYSRRHQRGNYREYFFGLLRRKCSVEDGAKWFVVFICGDEEAVFVIPMPDLVEMLVHCSTSADGQEWKIGIAEKGGVFLLRKGPGEVEDIGRYKNAHSLIGERP